MPFVGAVSGHHVDGTALEVAVAHVVGGELHADLVNGFEGNRGAAGGQTGADAEGVVEGCAVHGDVGTAVVGAAECCTHLGGNTLRGELQDVVQTAAHRRGHLDQSAIEVDADAGMVDVHRRILPVAENVHLFDSFGGALQQCIHYGGLAQRCVHIAEDSRFIVEAFHTNDVWTTS